MLCLKKCEPVGPTLFLEYEVRHMTPGAEGTVLAADLRMTIDANRTKLCLSIDNCEANNTNAALDKMAAWLRRLADGMEDRTVTEIPVG